MKVLGRGQGSNEAVRPWKRKETHRARHDYLPKGVHNIPSHLGAEVFARRRVAGLALIEKTEEIAWAGLEMARRSHQGGKLIAFGNGQSSADAQHIAVEFVHPVIVGKRVLPAISLTNDSATLTGLANREGWNGVFVHQFRYLARPRDIAVGLSQNGLHNNVLRGLEVAKALGLLTVALLVERMEMRLRAFL